MLEIENEGRGKPTDRANARPTMNSACPPDQEQLSTGANVVRKTNQDPPKTRRIDYSPHVLLRLFNSVAWRQQIGAGTWPPGLKLIVFVKTRRHSSFWRASYWQIQSMLASDLNLPRIS